MLSNATNQPKSTVELGYKRAKHKFYSSLDDQWIILSSSKAFDYFRTRRDEIGCVFNPPYFVNQINVEDRVRDSFWQIVLERNITKFRQKFGVWSKEISKCFSKLVISITLCQQFWSNLEIFRIEIQNASTTPSKSNYNISKGPRSYLCTQVPCLAVKKWKRSILTESNIFCKSIIPIIRNEYALFFWWLVWWKMGRKCHILCIIHCDKKKFFKWLFPQWSSYSLCI